MNYSQKVDMIESVAIAFNKRDFKLFEALLSNDFIYYNQRNGIQVSGKVCFLEYIQDVFEVMKFDAVVFAELGYINNNLKGENSSCPCIILAEGRKEQKSALLLIEEENGQIIKMNLFTNEDERWDQVEPTNLYPGYIDNIETRYLHFTIRANKLNYLRLCNVANQEFEYLNRIPDPYDDLRNWYTRYAGLFDYVYDKVKDDREVMFFKKCHADSWKKILLKNNNLLETFLIDQADYIDFLVSKSSRIIFNETGTCCAELKKEEDHFIYTLTWIESGKFVGDYVKPFKATLPNVNTFNEGCKIVAERLLVYMEIGDLDKILSIPPAFGVLTYIKREN